MKCGKKNHFSSVCKSRGKSAGRSFEKKPQSNVRSIDSEDDDNEYVFSLGGGDDIMCVVGGTEVLMKIDSGTKRNLIPLTKWKELKLKKIQVLNQIQGSDVKLTAYGQSTPLPVRGRFEAKLSLNGQTSRQWFYVVEQGDFSLLGKVAAEKHGVLKTGVGVNAMKEEFPKMKGNWMNKYI